MENPAGAAALCSHQLQIHQGTCAKEQQFCTRLRTWHPGEEFWNFVEDIHNLEWK